LRTVRDIDLPAGAAARLHDDRFQQFIREGRISDDGRLHVSPVKAATPPEADALADWIDAMLPHARITEVMHEVSRATGFAAAFTNLRTGERCDNENALLATILADASNLGLTRMAAASQGVTRDQLIWIADAYIRPETYKAALARIINAHHALPIAAIWGDGLRPARQSASSSSSRRSGIRGCHSPRTGRITTPGSSWPQSTRIVQRKRRPTSNVDSIMVLRARRGGIGSK
jgi:hypothetical protein